MVGSTPVKFYFGGYCLPKPKVSCIVGGEDKHTAVPALQECSCFAPKLYLCNVIYAIKTELLVDLLDLGKI